jgi:hypothetical protein
MRGCKSEKKHCGIRAIAVWMLIVSLSFIPLVSASHPSSADSDNDGIPDGWESKHRLNPDDPGDARRDYNHDGLTTLEEYKRGVDPFNRDTDGDKLSNYGEVTGLFGFVTDPLNVDTDEDGLTDLEESAAYISGRNKTQKDELFVDAAIIDDLKKQYYPYHLCPTDPDVDNDGLLDGEELSRGTSPTTVDFDADGLTDFDEVYTYGTNPTNVDTDGDWLSDREELTGGSYGITTDPSKGEERVAIEALNKGANRFIKKEGSPNALFDTLGRYIQEVVEERHKDPNISKFIAKLIEQDDKIKDLKRSNRKLNRLLENLEPMPQPKESRVDIATIVNEHLRLIILGILVDQPAGEDDYKSLSERELIKEIHHKFDLWVKPEMLRTSLNALKEKGIILDAAGRIAITPFHLR